jgi:hypothetical protein
MCRVFGDAVREETVRVLTDKYAGRLQALVLAGSLSRDEATVIEEYGRQKCLGDAEFLLAFDKSVTIPTSRELEPLLRQIEARLEQRNILCHVVAGTCRGDALRWFRPGIFAYELRTHGKVVWGNGEILSLLPGFSASDIPREDAWRMLCNRMIEQLEFECELSLEMTQLSCALFYRVVKLYLDMATSLLVFAGAYRPTYRERAEHLKLLANSPASVHEFPFPLYEFADRVRACTLFKLQEGAAGKAAPTGKDLLADAAFWKEAISYAHLLWRWELVRLTGASNDLSNRQLLGQWIRFQPACQRARGWLSVLRAQGWHRSWRNWPRWWHLALRASPRYCVYAAASELLFFLHALLDTADGASAAGLKANELLAWLPVVSERGPNARGSDWRQVASEIVRNYKEFLMETQA